jgi:hypothetical protein
MTLDQILIDCYLPPMDENELPYREEEDVFQPTSKNFASGSTKNQQKSVGHGCYLGHVDLDIM